MVYQDDKWHFCSNNVFYYDAPTKFELIRAYFDNDLSEFEVEVLEHWICTEYLATKLIEQGETVVEDVMGIEYIYCRCFSGQSFSADSPIKRIYEDLISN